ncbi:Glycosyl transferase, group 1 family protein [Alloactinosynnema sp. L-07]|uniref:glycosyltransferase family 4 protein n=1 Tax=Alloactinosynnema sp. L-07 TaxID=1653480 RepID=UPI00065EF379|nr:glycosyltransferase family 4 protein [Alloactinosynnema sp. L-07]CRK56907.1 Glycosyl transferase, group 1 family protein [Alloactinosynnema sp. L-07]
MTTTSTLTSTVTPSLMFLLDSPNIWRGQALAGTPARVLALAEHSHRAGAKVTLVLCDRGADYGTEQHWPMDTVLVHPADFYTPPALVTVLGEPSVDFLLLCEAESLAARGRDLARRLGARLVYDVHDDESAVAASLGEPADVVEEYRTTQRVALAGADHVIVSTRNEATLAASASVPAERTAMLPNGADPTQRTCWGPDPDAGTLVFLGNLFYEPNARALASIRSTILPALHAAGTDVRVRVVGRGPAALTRPAEGIEFTGRVDTIDEALRGASLALAPLEAGSGAKMKVLDYLAAGLPVLGTSEAVTGLPLDHPGVLVDDDLHAWPSLITTLLRDPGALREVGQAGRECVERGLSWQQIGTDLLRNTHTWLAATSTTPPLGLVGGVSGPRWLAEHAGHNALGDPDTTSPGHPRWLRESSPTASRKG